MNDSARDLRVPERSAVVIGGGVAGLLAAAVACKHFDHVVLLDRDDLLGGRVEKESVDETAKRRGGVPQLAHPHMLLQGGLDRMDQLLPGFKDKLRAAGGVPLDCLKDIHIFDHGMTNEDSRGPSSIQVLAASRRTVEQTLRDAVLAAGAGRLELRAKSRVEGLCWSDDKRAVTGVVLRGGEALPADLVIDASGRHSQLPVWLGEAGWARPQAQKVDAQLCYVSRTVQLPEAGEFSDPIHAAIVCFGRPAGQRGGAVLPGERGTAAVGLYGVRGEMPPQDEEGWLQYAASLPDDRLFRVLQASKPISPLIKYAGLKNVLRCYHSIQMPPGVVAVGDSVMELNPVYGQGMTVAGLGAVTLEEALGRALPPLAGAARAAGKAREAALAAGLARLAASFQRDLHAAIAPAWLMSSGEDSRYPGSQLEGVAPPSRLLMAYIDGCVKSGLEHRPTYETFWQVAHFLRPSYVLFSPAMLWHVGRQLLREAWAGLASRLPGGLATAAK